MHGLLKNNSIAIKVNKFIVSKKSRILTIDIKAAKINLANDF